MKYRKKPVVVEAVEIDYYVGDDDRWAARWDEIKEFCSAVDMRSVAGSDGELISVRIDNRPLGPVPFCTLQTVAHPGDWLVRDENGVIWGVDAADFAATYEKADEA